MKNKLPRVQIYGPNSLKIAFEFGIVLSETAKKMRRVVTPAMSIKAEKILINEMKTQGPTKVALNFVPLILSILETK